MTPRVTIQDVANLAKVTKGTVSRVLSGKGQISKDKQEAVLAAVETLNYIPNRRARALATGRTAAVAVVMTEPMEHFFHDPTFSLILKGIYEGMDGTDYLPVLLHATAPAEEKKIADLASTGSFDALIHLSPWADHGLLASLATAKLPVVLCGFPVERSAYPEFSVVYSDDVLGAKLAASYCLSQGVKKPVVISGEEGNPAAEDRVKGYREIYAQLHEENRVLYGGWAEADGALAVAHLREQGIDFDCLLCGSDRIARGAINYLLSEGVKIPAGVKVIGFDDNDTATSSAPHITTVAQPMVEQGKRAFQVASEMVEGEVAGLHTLDVALKERESA